MTRFSKKLCASSTHTNSYTVTFNIIFEARWMKWTRNIQMMMVTTKKGNKKRCTYFSTHIIAHYWIYLFAIYMLNLHQIIGACVLVHANREFYFLSFAQQKLIICIFTNIRVRAQIQYIVSTVANQFYGLNIFRRQAVK